MSFEKALNIFLLAMYAVAIVFALSAGVYSIIRDKKAKDGLRAVILKKLQAGIDLSAQETRTMAKGSAIPRLSVNKLVYRLLHDTNDPAMYAKIRSLSLQLEKEEPFDELPEEVKPSLLRLVELCDASPQRSDHALLSPIQKSLSSFVELKVQVEKSKRFAKWVNVAGMASLIIGVWGVYLSWKSPGIKEIEAVVIHAVRESALPPASAPAVDLRNKQ